MWEWKVPCSFSHNMLFSGLTEFMIHLRHLAHNSYIFLKCIDMRLFLYPTIMHGCMFDPMRFTDSNSLKANGINEFDFFLSEQHQKSLVSEKKNCQKLQTLLGILKNKLMRLTACAAGEPASTRSTLAKALSVGAGVSETSICSTPPFNLSSRASAWIVCSWSSICCISTL